MVETSLPTARTAPDGVAGHAGIGLGAPVASRRGRGPSGKRATPAHSLNRRRWYLTQGLRSARSRPRVGAAELS